MKTLATRAYAVRRLVEDWYAYENGTDKERAELERKLGAKVIFKYDTREAQERIEKALAKGQQPREEDLRCRTPNFPATIAQYAVAAIDEHRSAISSGVGNQALHLDCIAHWRLVYSLGTSGAPTMDCLYRRVVAAIEATTKVVSDYQKTHTSAKKSGVRYEKKPRVNVTFTFEERTNAEGNWYAIYVGRVLVGITYTIKRKVWEATADRTTRVQRTSRESAAKALYQAVCRHPNTQTGSGIEYDGPTAYSVRWEVCLDCGFHFPSKRLQKVK